MTAIVSTPGKSSRTAMDGQELNALLGLYLLNLGDEDLVINDDGGGAYPADVVLYQLIDPELTELSEIATLGNWHCVVALIVEFTVKSLAIAMNATPPEAIAQIGELLTELKSDLMIQVKDARLGRSKEAP
jgi:hypothetical protein